jgi:hypothetical protein
MAEISMLITSIDPLAAYKVCDDLIVELVDVTATLKTIRKVLQWARGGFRLSNLTKWSNTNRTEGTYLTTGKSK